MWISINMQKISLFHQFILHIYSIFDSRNQTNHFYFWRCPPKTFSFIFSAKTRLGTPTFDHAQQKVFDQLSIFVNLYQHAKHKAVSSICFGEVGGFWAISQEQDFSQIFDMWRYIANNINLYYRTNLVKIIDQIFL